MSRPVVVLRFLGIASVLLAARPVMADGEAKKVDSSLMFLTSGQNIPFLIDTDPFVAWLKPVFAGLDAQFAAEAKPRTVAVQITLHPDEPAEVAVAGTPALSEAEAGALLKVADAAKAPRSRITDCAFRLMLKVNGGAPEESGPLKPPLVTPAQKRELLFRAAGTAKKLALLQRWARTVAIPLLAAYGREADPKFEGVRNLGKALADLKPEAPIDVEALTDRNPDYWRAMLEMVPGNPFVPTAQVALHAANGNFGRARSTANVAAPFDAHNSGAGDLLAEFQTMIAIFDEDLGTRVRKGIALNDQGRFDDAVQVFDAVLKDYPRSAWALYERFHTGQEKGIRAKVDVDRLLEGWSDVRKAILEADPLYPSMASASGRDEVYDLLLRKETETLFEQDGKFGRDLVRYADIALDLGQPGFAAMIYWNVLSGVKPEEYGDRNVLEEMLYCLEQLGIKEIKTNFKGDHAAEFRRIDGERARRKHESPAFQNFVDPKEADPKARIR